MLVSFFFLLTDLEYLRNLLGFLSMAISKEWTNQTSEVNGLSNTECEWGQDVSAVILRSKEPMGSKVEGVSLGALCVLRVKNLLCTTGQHWSAMQFCQRFVVFRQIDVQSRILSRIRQFLPNCWTKCVWFQVMSFPNIGLMKRDAQATFPTATDSHVCSSMWLKSDEEHNIK